MRRGILVGVSCVVLGAAAVAQGQYEQRAKIVPTDGSQQAEFGNAVAIAEGLLIVGAFREDNQNGSNAGAVYLFDLETGAQVRKITAADGDASDLFGYTVAADAGMLVVGSRGDDDRAVDAGAAYVYDLHTGALLHKLTASDGRARDRFSNVAIDEGLILVGAGLADVNAEDSGAAYLFDAVTGAELHKLAAPDGGEDDFFGSAVAIDDGLALVGAFWHAGRGGSRSGAGYVFEVAGGGLVMKLEADDAQANAELGRAVAMADGVAALGATVSNNGDVYVFDVATGAQIHRLTVDGTLRSSFGGSLCIAEGMLGVGAVRDAQNGFDAGAAYLFDLRTGDPIATLLADDPRDSDAFGDAVAIGAGRVAVGATLDDDQGTSSGSAYVFAPICRVDLTGDEVVDTRDVVRFLGEWAAGGRVADWNRDGAVNTADLTAFLNDWVAGC